MPDYLIGGSPAIKRIRSLLTKLSGQTSPLIITGELGVGKFLLATRIHANSLLKNHPFESVDFSNLREHEQRIRLLGGSPPDLPTTRRSVLEMPTTVILKHIDCTPKFLQERLTEAIQNKEVVRLGTNQVRPVRCRLLFIFNDHPKILLKKGSIYTGLFKILSRYQIIHIPTLKERKEDIKDLAQHFVTQYQVERYRKLDKKFIEMLMKHKWKSNILEFKAFIKALDHPPAEVLIDQNDTIGLSMMNMMIDEAKEFSLKDALSKIGDSLTRRTWKRQNKNNLKTSYALGMSEGTVRNVLR